MAVRYLGSIAFAVLVSACGANDTAAPGVGGAAGAAGIANQFSGGASGVGGATTAGGETGGGGAPADCAHIDFASYATAPKVSFRDDVLPIFGLSCTLSDCHRPTDHRAGLNLGYRCAPDPTSKWLCRFPTAPTTDGDDGMPQPDDAATIAAMRASLFAPANTVNGGAVARVSPMHPEQSFLLQKLAGTQNAQNYMCTNQDPSHSTTSMVLPCGDSMPLGGDLWCEGKPRARFDAIATWIAQGAQDD
jgi:hypothetical protein